MSKPSQSRVRTLVPAMVFLAAVAVFVRVTASIFGVSVNVINQSPRTEYAYAWALGAIAISQFTPTAPHRVNVLRTLTTLSLAGLAVGQSHLPPARSHPVSSVPWNALVQNAAQKLVDQSRLTVGWTLNTGTQNLEQALASSPGLSVLAPKWLQVDGLNGAISGSIQPAVVQYAHKRGVKVWAVVDNGFNGVLSHEILQYADQQTMLIKAIVSRATAAGVNGINLDFEGLLPTDRWNFSRFVSLLGAALRAHGMQLSVDLPPDLISGNNNGPYNHSALAHAANYIILMAYDQYWGGDSQAGPTASLPWVKAGLADMLNTGVPARKLILGVPFYTQNWSLGKQGQVLSSQALSLVQLKNTLQSMQAHETWLPRLGLHFVSYASSGVRHDIWVEDRRSLLLSLAFVRRESLAGAAAWYLGLERPGTWLSLVDSVRSG